LFDFDKQPFGVRQYIACGVEDAGFGPVLAALVPQDSAFEA